ncbi:MAG: amidohydrolase family protein [Candidatus Desulfofervidus auxilii]|nr:amidohydrolase family protein [Candidatus Desulfofervidus auxilii]
MNGFKIHRAKWILPIFCPPIENGAIAISQGKILEVGNYKEIRKKINGEVIDHGEGILFPALVNVHTHLELSALKGIKKDNFVDWLSSIIVAKMGLKREKRKEAEKKAYNDLKITGTALFGNIKNIPENDNLPGEVIFFEFIGFNENIAQKRWKNWLNFIETYPKVMPSAHSPYSVHPKFLKKIKKLARENKKIFSIHVAESEAEVEFLLTGKGKIASLLKEKGVWEDGLIPKKRPIDYLESLKILDSNTLCVHCIEVTQKEIEILKKYKVKICICPRSNANLGLKKPPLFLFKKFGLFLCLGTDSLASNEDLNLFKEMGYLLNEGIFSPSELLEMGTWKGSIALGFGCRFGTFFPHAEAKILFSPIIGKNLAEAVIIAGIERKVRWIENYA